MQNQKKSVLVLASTFPRWENDTTPPFVYELEKRIAQSSENYEIIVLAPHAPGAKKFEKRDNLTIHRFQYFWPAKYQRLCYDGGILPNLKKNKLLYFQVITILIAEFFAALKIIRAKNVDFIHAHWIIPQGLIALLFLKLLNIQYMVTTHGGDIYGLQSKLLLSLKRKCLENAKSITVVSTAIKDEIHEKINPELKIHIIPMGVDTKIFNPNKYKRELLDYYEVHGAFLLFVGRLAEKKGIRYLIDAMPSVLKSFPDVKLIIVGDGTLMKELTIQTKKLKLMKSVIFTGAIANSRLPNYFSTADILIVPSIETKDGDKEGMPVTILEGFASGTNVIATDIGGIKDVVVNNKTGVVVNEKDKKALSNAICKLLNNKKAMSIYKKNALHAVKKFDWSRICYEYKTVFNSL